MRIDLHSPVESYIKKEIEGLKTHTHGVKQKDIIGYGRAFRETLNALEKLYRGRSDIEITEYYTGGDIQIYFGSARDVYKEHYERKSKRFIIFTMWETTHVPEEILHNLKVFDEIIVPCQWCKDVYRENGVTKPIHIVPLGINADDWPYMERNRNGSHPFNLPGQKKDFGKSDNPFTIIWQGTVFGDRKGGEIVKRIFEKLNLPNSYLILKINPMYSDLHAPFDLILAPNIRSVGLQLPQEKLLELIERADLSVFPSHGEGFGLIPLEHMATGLPSIVADNTGMSQYCNPEYNLPVECDIMPGIYGTWCGQSYKPNEWQIEEYIKWAYENRDAAKELGRKGSAWVKENWTYENTAKILMEQLLCQNELSQVQAG